MKIDIKTEEEIEKMREGGKKLHSIKSNLKKAVKRKVNALEIENLAVKLIKEAGGEASFKMVPDYSWATCVNVNSGVVHGIPKAEMIFKDGDVVSVDVGMYYKGFHTDTSFSVLVGKNKEIESFLEVGKKALKSAIKVAKPGKKIGDISEKIESTVKSHGASPIQSLVGHGVGRELHEEPMIPCFVSGSPHEKVVIKKGMTLAIEVMYSEGGHTVKLDEDGWTISTKDGKIAALFEETVAITSNGPIILT